VTPTLRKYDAGIMELGVEYMDHMAIPPKQEKFLLSGFCIKSCTQLVMKSIRILESSVLNFLGSDSRRILSGKTLIRRGPITDKLWADNAFGIGPIRNWVHERVYGVQI